MKRPEATPTLLIFTLGPESESARRRLLPPSLRAAETLLHKSNLDTALLAGRQAGFRIVVASPRHLDLPCQVEQVQQRGSTFAERLRSAVHEIQQRYPDGPLVVVGTDSPDLDTQHLREAVNWLQENPRGVVLGPARDGGFYLLAAREPLDLALATARWRRRDTRRTLQDNLRREGRSVRLLDELVDLDHAADLEGWLAKGASRLVTLWLSRLLRSLLANWRRPLVPGTQPLPLAAWTAPVSGRGPPR